MTIRFGNGLTPGHRNELLLAPDYTLVCSPQLLSGARPLRTPEDLRWHALIHDESLPKDTLGVSWETWLRIAGAPDVDASRGLRFGSGTLVLEAALEHQGVALAPRQLVAAEVAAGRLVTPFDVTMASRYFYYLATPEAVADRPTVRAFRSWLLKEIASAP